MFLWGRSNLRIQCILSVAMQTERKLTRKLFMMCLHRVIRGLTQVSLHSSGDIIRVVKVGAGIHMKRQTGIRGF